MADVTNSRTVTTTGGQAGPTFSFDGKTFSHTLINHTIRFNAVEKWTLANNYVCGNAIQLNNVPFKIIAAVVLARLEDFTSTANACMFHGHFSSHEDERMMGPFVVVPQGGRASLVLSDYRSEGADPSSASPTRVTGRGRSTGPQ